MLALAGLLGRCSLDDCIFEEDGPTDCSIEARAAFVRGELFEDWHYFAPELRSVDLRQETTAEAIRQRVQQALASPRPLTTVFTPEAFAEDLERQRVWEEQGVLQDTTGLRLDFLEGGGFIVAENLWPPGSATQIAGLVRGARIFQVDGTNLIGLTEASARARFEGRDRLRVGFISADGRQTVQTELVRGPLRIEPIGRVDVLSSAVGPVGYVEVRAFHRDAGDALIDAFEPLAAAAVRRVIIDIRYAGDGVLEASHALSNLLVGASRAASPSIRLRTRPAHDGCGIADRDGLNFAGFERVDNQLTELEQVIFIMTERTREEAEQVWNAVRPFVDVATVGRLSGGGSFEYLAATICEEEVWVIPAAAWRNKNEQIIPVTGVEPDCRVEDDYSRPIGDAQDPMIVTARALIETGGCAVF